MHPMLGADKIHGDAIVASHLQDGWGMVQDLWALPV